MVTGILLEQCGAEGGAPGVLEQHADMPPSLHLIQALHKQVEVSEILLSLPFTYLSLDSEL